MKAWARGLGAALAALAVTTTIGHGLASPPRAQAATQPAIKTLEPSAVLPGTSVVILGQGFQGATKVTVGGAAVDYTVYSDSEILASVPATFTGGSVVVTTPGGAVSASLGLFHVTSISPQPARPGDTLTLTGSGFTAVTSGLWARLGGSTWTADANAVAQSDTRMTVKVPADAQDGDALLLSIAHYTVNVGTLHLAGGPHIQRIDSPGAFPGQNSLDIYGAGFTGATKVLVGGESVPFVVWNDGTILINDIPADFKGGQITVITPGGSDSYPLELFSVTSVSEHTGSIGDTITITGTGLRGVNFAYLVADRTWSNFATVAQLHVISDTQLTFVVPPGTPPTSTIVLSNADQLFSVPGTFQLVAPSAPTAVVSRVGTTAVIPGQGLPVYGSGFTGTTRVLLGGVPTTFVVYDDGTMNVDIPMSYPGGDLTIVTPSGSTTFPLALYSVTAVSPPKAVPGTSVTVTGTGLASTRYAYLYDPVTDNYQVAALTVVNDGQLTVSIPSGTPAGSQLVLSNGAKLLTVPAATFEVGS